MRRPIVYLPDDLRRAHPPSDLFGYRDETTQNVNVVSCVPPTASRCGLKAVRVGSILADAVASISTGLYLLYVDGAPTVVMDGSSPEVRWYTQQSTTERVRSLVDTNLLDSSAVVISGCGSVGSLLGLELARSGVGSFLLIDDDTFEYENVSRHQGGISDVGRRKVEILAERILNIQPNAKVVMCSMLVEEVSQETFSPFLNDKTLLIGAADSRLADLYLNKLSCQFGAPFLSVGLWNNAFAGEVFWSVPPETPCYYCLFGGRAAPPSARIEVKHRGYTTDHEEDLPTQPGLYADIAFTTLVGVKFALALLQYTGGELTGILDSMSQFTLVCNSLENGGESPLAELFTHSFQVSRSITCDRLDGCPHCSVA